MLIRVGDECKNHLHAVGPHRVNDALQGLEAIVDRKDVLPAVRYGRELQRNSAKSPVMVLRFQIFGEPSTGSPVFRRSPSGPRSKRWPPAGERGQPGERTVRKYRRSGQETARRGLGHLSLGHVELVLPQFPVGQGDDDAGCPVTCQAERAMLLASVPGGRKKKKRLSRKGLTHRLQWRSRFARWPGGEIFETSVAVFWTVTAEMDPASRPPNRRLLSGILGP